MEAADEQLSRLFAEIDELFEPSPELHVLLSSKSEGFLAETEPSPAGPIVCPETIAFVGRVLHAILGRRELDRILNCHPRLGATKVESPHSQNEQRSLVSDPTETKLLRDLNQEYEKTFPGLRYVVFVNGRPRSEIMANMRDRIQRADMDAERREGIDAMCQIARDRLSKKENQGV